MFASEPPVTMMPVAFGPVPPLTSVCGELRSPTETLLDPPVMRRPVASPLVRVTPWTLTPLILALLTPENVTGIVVPEP